MSTSPYDMELLDRCSAVLRRTRDSDMIWICSEVVRRVAAKELPARKVGGFDKRAYQREYMRKRRASKAGAGVDPNPFE